MLIHDKGFWWVAGLYAAIMVTSVFVYFHVSATDALVILIGGCLTFAILIIRKLKKKWGHACVIALF